MAKKYIGFFVLMMIFSAIFLYAEIGNSSAQLSLADLINPDGSLTYTRDIQGSFDPVGLKMIIKQNGEPVFIPFETGPMYKAEKGWNWDDQFGPDGLGMNGFVRAFAVMEGNLYVAGDFTQAGGKSANRIARWDGSTWSALGSGLNSSVYALAVIDNNLYAGGWFWTAGGVSANRVAKWNGSSWSSLGNGLNNNVYALAVLGEELYAGGRFGGVSRWDGFSWSSVGTGMDGLVYALTVIDGNLYAGGDFICESGGSLLFNIAKWDGAQWSSLGTGMNSWVYALAVKDGDLYAGGYFTQAGGTNANRIARWDGNTWSPLGSGMSGLTPIVYSLAVMDGELYAGGGFSHAGGNTSNYIARWDGNTWSSLGIGMEGNTLPWVYALASAGNDLFAGGGFTYAGGKPSVNIARWYYDGTYTVSLSSNPENGTVLLGAGQYQAGEIVNIQALADTLQFVKWEGLPEDVLLLGDQYSYNTTFSMPERNVAYTAVFTEYQPETYTLALFHEPFDINVDLQGAGDYYEGETVIISADYIQKGFVFSEWTGEHTHLLDDPQSSETSLLMPAQDIFFIALFVLEEIEYKVTLFSEPHDIGAELTGAGYYKEGDIVNISATIVNGYQFYAWTGDYVSLLDDPYSASTHFIMPSHDINMTAFFEILWTVSLSAVPDDIGVVLTGQGQYIAGTDVLISASLSKEYQFVKWAGSEQDIALLDDQYTSTAHFLMPERHISYTALWAEHEPDTYTLALFHEPFDINVDLQGAGDYYEGDTVIISADYIQKGFIFSEWTGEHIHLLDDPQSSETSLLMPAQDIFFIALFVLEEIEYKVTLFTEPHDIGAELTGAGYYIEGDIVNISATIVNSYQFYAWTGDYASLLNDPYSASTHFIMPSHDINLTALFEILWTVSLSAVPEDIGVVLTGQGEYIAGTEVIISASLSKEYQFVKWTGSEQEIALLDDQYSSTAQFTMPQRDVAFTAIFEDFYNVTLSAQPDDIGIILTGQGEYIAGTEVLISASLSKEYQFVQWTGSEQDIALLDDQYSSTAHFLMPERHVSYTAVWAEHEPETYTLALFHEPFDINVNLQGAGDYCEGETVIISADYIQKGFVFSEWTGEYIHLLDDPQSSETFFLMPAHNLTFIAVFVLEEIEYKVTLFTEPHDIGAELTGAGYYIEGDIVNISASIDNGYQFYAWTGDYVSLLDDPCSASTHFIMPSHDINLTALFEILWTVSLSAVPDDIGIVLTGQGEYIAGTDVIISASLPREYQFVKWTGSEQDIALLDDQWSLTTLFIMPDRDTSFTALFELMEEFSVTFIISDEYDNPVDGALITVEQTVDDDIWTESTDIYGIAIFSLANGEYFYTVSKDGYRIETGSFAVEGEDLELEDVLYSECSLEEALNAEMEWSVYTQPSGLPLWFAQSNTVFHGNCAAQSGPITHNQGTFIETEFHSAGTLTFWWKVDSEAGYDWLRFYINGINVGSISGDIDWHEMVYELEDGENILTWGYEKDGSISAGEDSGWLDYVNFIPHGMGPDASIKGEDIHYSPSNPLPGDIVEITARVYNIGTDPVTSGQATFYYSMEPGKDLQMIDSYSFGLIPSEEYTDITIFWHTNENMDPTIYLITVILTGIMPEDINPDNNSAYIELALPVELAYFRALGVDTSAIVQWKTLSETDNLGFNLYRLNVSKVNPYVTFLPVKLNDALIPGQGTSTNPVQYSFTDNDINRLLHFVYILETVSVYGETKEYRTKMIRMGIKKDN